MDKKDLNDISADEIIRRLNKTLGIEPESDEETEENEDDVKKEEKPLDDDAPTAIIPEPDAPSPDVSSSASDDSITISDDTADNIFESIEANKESELFYSFDAEQDTTLNNIFYTKKAENLEFTDSLIGFSDTLDRLDDSVFQPAPMKRSSKKGDDAARGVDAINISKNEDDQKGSKRAFFNDAEYDDVEFPDSKIIISNVTSTDEQTAADAENDANEVSDTSDADTVVISDTEKTATRIIAEENEATSEYNAEKTIIADVARQNEPEPAEISNEDSSKQNHDFGFDRVYKDEKEVSSDGYNDTEHSIMNAMDFSKALEDVYDNEKENADDIASIGAIGEKIKKPAPNPVKRSANEYTNTAQKKPFKDRYKKLYKSFRTKFFCSLLFTLILLGLETFASLGYKLPHFIDPTFNSRVLILVCFQIFLIVFAFFFGGFIKGIASLFSGKITGEFLTASFSLITVIFGVYQAITAPTSPVLIFSPCAFCISATLLNAYRDLKREIYAFNIASSNMVKYSIDEFTPSSESIASEEFYNYLPENPTMLKINKTSFVENFVSNSRKHSKSKTHFLIAGIACFLSALIVFFTLLLLKKGFDTSFTYSFILFSAIIPSSLFTAFSFPLFKASSVAFQDNSAFIGECVADDFSEAAVVSFDDKEVFPSYALKLLSVKVYGENRIDHVLFAATSVFKKIGGPLYDVFENASREIEKTDNVKIFSVYNDGIEATVNEEHILLGSASFMEKKNFIPMYTDDDQNAESKNAKRIMYMASGGTIIAKLYLKYTADSDFSSVLQQLTDAGMCIAIKTFDPNIDTSLLAGEINIKKYPVRVVKCTDKSELSMTLKSSDATIISKGSAKSLLKVLTNCRKLASVIKTGVLVSFVSIIIGIMIVAFSLFAGVEDGISSLVVVLYQLLWMLTCNIIARIYIK